MMKESQLSPVADGARCNNADFDFERRKRESSCLQLVLTCLHPPSNFPGRREEKGENVTNELQPTYIPTFLSDIVAAAIVRVRLFIRYKSSACLKEYFFHFYVDALQSEQLQNIT
eukprot:scaffold3436_cov156-Skeletonema_menzelii.AAC.11